MQNLIMEPRSIVKTRYSLIKTLGQGSNSRIKLGFNPELNQYYAIKIIKLTHPHLNLATLQQGLEALSQIKHPNIINIIEFSLSATYIKKNGKSYKVVAIVSEFAPNGDICDYIINTGRFSEEISRTYFQTLLKTIEYCHSQGITHRDLKPEHLLLDEKFNLKIADFGLTNLLSANQPHAILGTDGYMSPEIHTKKPYSGVTVDLFSSGIILFAMVSGGPPFSKALPNHNPHYKTLFSGRYDLFWRSHERMKPQTFNQENFFSDEFRDFIEAMLSPDPEARPSLKQIKEHPWLNGHTVRERTLNEEFSQRRRSLLAQAQAQAQPDRQRQREAPQNPLMGRPREYASLEIEIDSEEKVTEQIDLDVEGKAKKDQSEAELMNLVQQINFDAEVKTEKDQPEAAESMPCVRIYAIQNIAPFFHWLCTSNNLKPVESAANENKYKVKCKLLIDDSSCDANVVLTKVDGVTTSLKFHRVEGSVAIFEKAIEEIKKLEVAIREFES